MFCSAKICGTILLFIGAVGPSRGGTCGICRRCKSVAVYLCALQVRIESVALTYTPHSRENNSMLWLTPCSSKRTCKKGRLWRPENPPVEQLQSAGIGRSIASPPLRLFQTAGAPANPKVSRMLPWPRVVCRRRAQREIPDGCCFWFAQRYQARPD